MNSGWVPILLGCFCSDELLEKGWVGIIDSAEFHLVVSARQFFSKCEKKWSVEYTRWNSVLRVSY